MTITHEQGLLTTRLIESPPAVGATQQQSTTTTTTRQPMSPEEKTILFAKISCFFCFIFATLYLVLCHPILPDGVKEDDTKVLNNVEKVLFTITPLFYFFSYILETCPKGCMGWIIYVMRGIASVFLCGAGFIYASIVSGVTFGMISGDFLWILSGFMLAIGHWHGIFHEYKKFDIMVIANLSGSVGGILLMAVGIVGLGTDVDSFGFYGFRLLIFTSGIFFMVHTLFLFLEICNAKREEMRDYE